MPLPKKVYCPSCGIDVEPFSISAGGEEVIHCSVCGLVLDLDGGSDGDEPEFRKLKRVGVAEDSDTLRNLLTKVLVDQGVTEEVFGASNGVEFVTLVNQHYQAKKALSLAILDVEMPMMSGVQAALSLREMEKQFLLKRKTPILFFTSRKCDDRFKSVLKQLEPSSYVNKGASSDPKELVRRVYKVLMVLLKQ